MGILIRAASIIGLFALSPASLLAAVPSELAEPDEAPVEQIDEAAPEVNARIDRVSDAPQLADNAVPDTHPARIIPASHPVKIRILDRIHSKENKRGEYFRIELAEPIILEDQELVPAGAIGQGQIVHAARARAGGKAGELILAARYIEHDGVRIFLRSFNWGHAGQDNAGLALAASLALTASALLISGGNVTVEPGMVGDAKIRNDTIIGDPKPDEAQQWVPDPVPEGIGTDS